MLGLLVVLLAGQGCQFKDSQPASGRRAGIEDSTGREPPFPGASRPIEILANRQFSVRESKFYGNGLEILLDSKAIKPSRIVEVESTVSDGDYFIVDVDTIDSRPLVTMAMARRSGRFMMFGDCRQGRTLKLPVLESVLARLKERFGATDANYFFPAHSTLGDVDLLLPLVKAHTPKGMVMVNGELVVFEEVAFELDPPGISEAERGRLRAEQFRSGPIIVTDDAVMKFRLAGQIEAERR